MKRSACFIIAAFVALLGVDKAEAGPKAAGAGATTGTVTPFGQIGQGILDPLTTFGDDNTFVAGGRLYNIPCISDDGSPTCGATITHNLPGYGSYDPNLSTVVLGGFRITGITGGTLQQGATYRIGAEVKKLSYDPLTHDFKFIATLDFGPNYQPTTSTFTGELEYWIVLTRGPSSAWTKTFDANCTGVNDCTTTSYIFTEEIPSGMQFMNSALQRFSMKARVASNDQIKEIGIDNSAWASELVSVWDPDTRTYSDKEAIRFDPTCKFVGKTAGLWTSLTCETRSVAFAGVEGAWELNDTQYGALLGRTNWSQSVTLSPIDPAALYLGMFTGLNQFNLKYSGAVPSAGNKEVRAGCFRPSPNPALGAIVAEGLLSNVIPPTTNFTATVGCMTGWHLKP